MKNLSLWLNMTWTFENKANGPSLDENYGGIGIAKALLIF